MEYLELGDLEKYITPKITDDDAKSITKQLLEGLLVLHQMDWVHRDLKPRNIFVVNAAPNWWIKIGDFGISKRLHNDQETQTLIGTSDYIPPEMVMPDTLSDYESDGERGPRLTAAVDIWSLGCVLHRLLLRRLPFTSQKALKSYCRGKTPLALGSVDGQQISRNSADLLLRMLKPHPEDRVRASGALKHPWLDVEESRSPTPTV